MTRKSAFLIDSLGRIGLNAAASTDDDGSTTIGTLYSISLGITASVRLDPQAPMMTGTLSAVISFSATAAASVGLLLLSSITSSIFLPSTPPLALISSAAILAPLTT